MFFNSTQSPSFILFYRPSSVLPSSSRSFYHYGQLLRVYSSLSRTNLRRLPLPARLRRPYCCSTRAGRREPGGCRPLARKPVPTLCTFVTSGARCLVLTPLVAGRVDAPGRPDRDGRSARQFPEHHTYRPGHALPGLSVGQLWLPSFPPRGLWSFRLHRQPPGCHTTLPRYVASALLSPDANLGPQTAAPRRIRCRRPTLPWSRPPSRSYLGAYTRCDRPFIAFSTASSSLSTEPAIFSPVSGMVSSRFPGNSGGTETGV